MANLGAKLAENLQIAQAATEAARLKAEQMQNEEQKAIFAELELFFEQVKQYWTDSIVSGTVEKDLGIQIGSSGPYEVRKEKIKFNPDKFYSAAHLYSQQKTDNVPGLFGTPKWDKQGANPYYLAWKKFEAWCSENGLKAVWNYCWDGGGVCSWYVLQPKSTVKVML